MKKTITPVISVILLIMLTIVAGGGIFFFVSSTVNSLQSSSDINDFSGGDTSKLLIVSISGNKSIVKNEGSAPVTKVSVFINGELINYTLSSNINPGGVAEINYTTQSIGQDLEIKILYNNGKISQLTSYATDNTINSGFI